MSLQHLLQYFFTHGQLEESNLEQTSQNLKEQQVVAHIEFDKEKQSLITQIQDLKGQYEITKVQSSKSSPILPVRMNNRLK
jgi:hypothetical protein